MFLYLILMAAMFNVFVSFHDDLIQQWRMVWLEIVVCANLRIFGYSYVWIDHMWTASPFFCNKNGMHFYWE